MLISYITLSNNGFRLWDKIDRKDIDIFISITCSVSIYVAQPALHATVSVVRLIWANNYIDKMK